MRLVALMLALLALLTLGGACKGDPVKCDQACRNYATLMFWKRADAEVAAAAADERDAVRKRNLGQFNSMLESGIDLCLQQCQSAGNTDQIECMIAAKTADQALACAK